MVILDDCFKIEILHPNESHHCPRQQTRFRFRTKAMRGSEQY